MFPFTIRRIVVFLTVLAAFGLLLPNAAVLAQGPAPYNPDARVHQPGPPEGAPVAEVELGPIVADGGFEAGTPNPYWEEFSVMFDTPICDLDFCGNGGGTGPHSGDWWAWFGGDVEPEIGILTQTVTIPAGTAELTFWLEIPATDNNGYLSVRMDGTEVFRVEEDTTGYETYALVTVDVSAYADGGAHELVFYGSTDANPQGVTNFFVDDVAITITGPTAVVLSDFDASLLPSGVAALAAAGMLLLAGAALVLRRR